MKKIPSIFLHCLALVLCVGGCAHLPSNTSSNGAVLDVREYGAIGDGVSLDSPSIQMAIDAAHARGGGEVLVPAGRYRSGTILLKDNVTLRLEKNAEILGSKDLDNYSNPDYFVDAVNQERGWCLIGIVDASNVALVGEGTINGRGQYFGQRGQRSSDRRPFLVRVVRSENVLLEGVRLRNSGAWVCHLFASRSITIRGLDIYSHANGNNDGIDVDSTSDVLIEDCVINTGDDALCIKATSPLPTANVLIRNCTLTSDWGAFKLGTESMGDFKNIRFIDSVIKDTRGGAIKILSMDGCRLEDLVIDNITVTNSDMALFMRLGERLNKYREPAARTPGHIKGVSISNITVETSHDGRLDAPTAIVMVGEKTDSTTHRIEDVAIRDVSITLEGAGRSDEVSPVVERTRRNNYPEYIFMFDPEDPLVYPAYGFYGRHIKNVHLENVILTTRQEDERPLVSLDNAHNVHLGISTDLGNGPFLKTRDSSGIAQP